ncbi:Cytochrome b5-like Heme/Steroid binding domain containing protein, putative [Angomonas deanei]|uniref:Cytochrome b5-like Heme/Steroid binding domain containing protein, putative n=1 Tax=Angomonas deanei TaxID=59799 RepID=A0A7G2CJY6_9TRYP|nr:Cytochrome b5-like Heme/Steroid binding domain containing protein, putative [Angomonas deanei]
MPPKYFKLDEIKKHNKPGDTWFIVDHKVYDVSQFAEDHPGGPDPLYAVAGGDASNGFKAIGHSDSAKEELEKKAIGEVHPDDIAKLVPSFQGTQSNTGGIAIVFVLLAAIAVAILRSLFS